MPTLTVALKANPYPVIIPNDGLKGLGRAFRAKTGRQHAFILTNPTVFSLHGMALVRALENASVSTRVLCVPDTEKSKSWATACSVLTDLSLYGRDHSFGLIAFGGGVVGDLGGFCASIYKRGIPYAQVPTTLLAQVDSSIGGKTGIDLEQGKNLVGSFYQPRLVFSDVAFLATLPRRQLVNGMAEVIKYACISDPALFTYLERNREKILGKDPASLGYIVNRCSRIKAKIVAQDEKEEKGIRTILNFGHTIGHAIEAAAHYQGIFHGEAVALGMAAACRISTRLKLLSQADAGRIEALMRAYGLARTFPKLPLSKVVEAHYHDKKFSGKRNRFVLLEKVWKTRVVEGVQLEVVKGALAGISRP